MEIGCIGKRTMALRVKDRALEVLDSSGLSDVLELVGTGNEDKAATAAFKSIIAERMAEYAIRALHEAKKRGTKVGAATLIIAANGR